MSNARILYVCQELTPYVEENAQSRLSRSLPQQIQERGREIRTFMPRYGCINERRNQLHEVIRLSGMNIVISDTDHQLIIKVASIPSARVQIYFIDNEDYFQRKYMLRDKEGKPFPDNDERTLFFSRGVIETVSKLRWSPDIVHCHGWFSLVMAGYIKRIFKDDPLFARSKVVLSLYDDAFPGQLDGSFARKLDSEGFSPEETALLAVPDYGNLVRFALGFADGLVAADNNVAPELVNYAREKGVAVLDCREEAEDNYADKYAQFYDEILAR